MLVQPENGMQGLHTCTCGANRSRRTTTPLSFTWSVKLMLNRARPQPRAVKQRSTKCNWQPILRSIARQSAPTDVRGPPAAVKHQPAETTKSRTSVKFQKRSSSLRVRTTPIDSASPEEATTLRLSTMTYQQYCPPASRLQPWAAVVSRRKTLALGTSSLLFFAAGVRPGCESSVLL